MKLARSENLPAVERRTDSSALAVAGLAAVYYVAARLTLSFGFAYEHPHAVPVWPGAGIALAALLLRGNSVWPGILLGSFAANYMFTEIGRASCRERV